jgi:hypothetical protein
MIERQPFNELAGEDRGWLRAKRWAKRHFSFASPRMVWGSLRVWNDDEIAPSAGFAPHTAMPGRRRLTRLPAAHPTAPLQSPVAMVRACRTRTSSRERATRVGRLQRPQTSCTTDTFFSVPPHRASYAHGDPTLAGAEGKDTTKSSAVGMGCRFVGPSSMPMGADCGQRRMNLEAILVHLAEPRKETHEFSSVGSPEWSAS